MKSMRYLTYATRLATLTRAIACALARGLFLVSERYDWETRVQTRG
jgi:hypothetical protein